MGAFIAASAAEFVGDIAISKLLAPDASLQIVLSVIVGLTTMVLGGCLAVRIRPGAANVLSAIILITVAIFMVTKSGSVPLWYQLTFLIAGPEASWAGGTLFPRRQM
jgi:hypothetical protein